MAAVTFTEAKIGLVNPQKARVKSYIAGATISPGDALYIDSSGDVQLADANGSAATYQFRGIALTSGAAGQAIDVCEEGELYGFDLSGLAYDDLVYVGDTAGDLADAAGTKTVVAGRVSVLADKDRTKVLYVVGHLNRLADVS